MKDQPHHIKQLNRKVIRSERREEALDQSFQKEFLHKPSEEQIKKQEKQKRKKIKQAKVPIVKSIEQRNQEMKHNLPILRKKIHNPLPKK